MGIKGNKQLDRVRDLGEVITATAINGAAANFSCGPQGCNAIGLYVDYTQSAATDVIITPTVSEDGTNFYNIETLGSSVDGAFPADSMTIVNDDGSTEKFYVQIYPIPSGANVLKVAFTGTSADANDVVTVRANLLVL